MWSFRRHKYRQDSYSAFQGTITAWQKRPRNANLEGVESHTVPPQLSREPASFASELFPDETAHTAFDSFGKPQLTHNNPLVVPAPDQETSAFYPSDSKNGIVQGHIDTCLVAYHQPRTAAAEQYRKLYTTIARAGRVRSIHSVLISSALAGEGKTFSAINLALTIAASGEQNNVLLVDTDLHRPQVHKLLGGGAIYGLADYLLGEVPSHQILSPTSVPGLTAVYAGKKVQDPFALLSSEKMGQFLREVRSQMPYSYIILDSSPVLLTSDPEALIDHADTVLLVVHAHHTPRDIVAKAIATIGAANILGCVFNGVTSNDFSYYNYYYNSDYYHSDKSQG